MHGQRVIIAALVSAKSADWNETLSAPQCKRLAEIISAEVVTDAEISLHSQ